MGCVMAQLQQRLCHCSTCAEVGMWACACVWCHDAWDSDVSWGFMVCAFECAWCMQACGSISPCEPTHRVGPAFGHGARWWVMKRCVCTSHVYAMQVLCVCHVGQRDAWRGDVDECLMCSSTRGGSQPWCMQYVLCAHTGTCRGCGHW